MAKEIGKEGSLAIVIIAMREQMRAAGDIEEQAIRRVERNKRRVAVAPVSELFEEVMVGRFVGLDNNEVGHCATRIGQDLRPGGCLAVRHSCRGR